MDDGEDAASAQVCAAELEPQERAQEPLDSVGLLYFTRAALKLKDFESEVRAPMDVEQFAHQSELLLELDARDSRQAVDQLLLKALESEPQLSAEALAELRASVFVRDSATLMAHTIQGALQAGAEQRIEAGARGKPPPPPPPAQLDAASPDQTWLCALCNAAQLTRRHMLLARFRQPVDMGDSARRVRLFVLCLVPSKLKSTKHQLETGRTLATLLSAAHFRRQLLDARHELQVRALMVVRAQQLARAGQLTNRHKYMLDARLHDSILSLTQTASQARRVQAAPAPRIELAESAAGSFARNPRTSKLFELLDTRHAGLQLRELTQSSSDDDNNNNNICNNNSSFQPDKLKLAELEAAARQPGRPTSIRSLCAQLEFGRSAWRDFARRLAFYPSDFGDAFATPRSLQKCVATTWFLYFGILLPTIAFSSLNTTQTQGRMGDLRKALLGQAFGGLGFALFGGQPLVIIMTTAPLCLYTKVIHQMCLDYGFPFLAMYAAVGICNALFLVLYSLLGFSRLMKWCTRSTEEIFALFIVIAFITDASKDMLQNFHRFYYGPACQAQNSQTRSMLNETNRTLDGHSLLTNSTQSDSGFRDIEQELEASVCRRETSLLFVLLMLGTHLGERECNHIYAPNHCTPTTRDTDMRVHCPKPPPLHSAYLSPAKRDLLADYALPTAVILMSLVGATLFGDIYVEKFPPIMDITFERAPVETLPVSGLLTAIALGFTLSLLFFMDQNISAAMVNTPQNRLKKGDAFHYDLLIIGLLNGCLTLYGLPMMHGVLPHSPLHARSLADIEEQVEDGHLREVVVTARETRVTGIVAHILLFGSLLLIPYPIAYIPRAVLNGLFLYMAITSLDGLQVFERIMLLFTEQNKYPPNHYIRRCPQRKIHQFTLLQLIQLLVMCLFGFSPINVVEMFFPVIILLMIPFRHRIVPKFISDKYLDALDGKH